MDKYKQFSVEDFLQDAFFCEWVKNPNPNNIYFWNTWLRNHPHMREVVEEAHGILTSFEAGKDDVGAAFYNKLKERIDNTLGMQEAGDDATQQRIVPMWLKVAAVIAVIGVGIFTLMPSRRPIASYTYSSDYGEIKKVTLPDGSEVTLNAKSALRYVDSGKGKRQVWLSGEAFFHIRHLEDQDKIVSKFVVHANKVDVEVLGTQFNINNTDREQTEVLLTSGKIKLSVNESGRPSVELQPDDKVVYRNDTKDLSLDRVSPGNYIAWMEHKYIFEKVTLEDLCQGLQRYYGKHFVIPHYRIRKQRLSGTLELQNEDTLIQTLSVLLATPVRMQRDSIIVGSE